MQYLKIKNWDKNQTYRKDRGTPPWIKIHRRILTNPKWAALSDQDKGHLISIWIVAADKNGLVPGDAGVLRKICGIDEPPNINKFIDLGFLAPDGQPNDNQVTTKRQPSDQTETETETETETKKPYTSIPPSRFDEFWAEYPRKVGKKRCKEIWKRRKFDQSVFLIHLPIDETKQDFVPGGNHYEYMADMIIEDVKNRKANHRKWIDGYVENPQTYLNGDRWEDEVEPQGLIKNGNKETAIQARQRRNRSAIEAEA